MPVDVGRSSTPIIMKYIENSLDQKPGRIFGTLSQESLMLRVGNIFAEIGRGRSDSITGGC
jgi:hypothetical protein